MSFSDAQVRSLILADVAKYTNLGASNIGARGRALLVALEALGSPTAAPGDPGAPPPTNPFPPTSDPTKGAAEVIRRAAYAPGFSAEWALVSDLGNGKITYRQVP
jgi:hypothetical protein